MYVTRLKPHKNGPICESLRRASLDLYELVPPECIEEIPFVFSEALLSRRRERNTMFVRQILREHHKTIDDVAAELGWRRSTAGAVRLGCLTLERFQEIVDCYNSDGRFVPPSRAECVRAGLLATMKYVAAALNRNPAEGLDESVVECLQLLAQKDESCRPFIEKPLDHGAMKRCVERVCSELNRRGRAKAAAPADQLVSICVNWLVVFALAVADLPQSWSKCCDQ